MMMPPDQCVRRRRQRPAGSAVHGLKKGCPGGIEPASTTFTELRAEPLHYEHQSVSGDASLDASEWTAGELNPDLLVANQASSRWTSRPDTGDDRSGSRTHRITRLSTSPLCRFAYPAASPVVQHDTADVEQRHAISDSVPANAAGFHRCLFSADRCLDGSGDQPP